MNEQGHKFSSGPEVEETAISLDCFLIYTCNQAAVKKSDSDLYFLWSQVMLTLTSLPH